MHDGLISYIIGYLTFLERNNENDRNNVSIAQSDKGDVSSDVSRLLKQRTP